MIPPATAVSKCLETLANVLGLHVVELWSHDHEGFGLVQAYVDKYEMKEFSALASLYHQGKIENLTSRNLCKRAMKSKQGFYWLAKTSKRMHQEIPLHTATCFHLPRDNVSSDVFVVGYSLKYIKFAQSRLNFLCWLSHAACVAAYSSSLYDFSCPSIASVTTGSDENQADRVTYDPFILASHSLVERGAGSSMRPPDASPVPPTSQRKETVPYPPPGPSEEVLGALDAVSVNSNLILQEAEAASNSATAIPSAASAVAGAILSLSVPVEESVAAPAVSTNDVRVTFQAPPGAIVDSEDHRRPSALSVATIGIDAEGAAAADAQNDIDDDLVTSSDLKSTATVRRENHPVNLQDLASSIRGGFSHCRGTFSFLIDNLPVRRQINRSVAISEFGSLEYLVSGSNSHVFSAIWQNQPVIIKMLQQDKIRNTVAVHEFDIECELLCRIDHPNVIRILGAGSVPRPFLILEKVQDLSHILELDSLGARPMLFRRRTFDYMEILKLAKNLADAMNYMHSDLHGNAMIIHRDLKPENLGFAADGTLKLFDFGLCRCVKKRASEDEAYTMTGNTGSVRFMAPEVVLNRPYTEKVDVYSFAILIWTVARNKQPFRSYNSRMIREKVVLGGERPSSERTWPKDFCALLEACWHEDSRRRPSFAEISARLNYMIHEGSNMNQSGRFGYSARGMSTSSSTAGHAAGFSSDIGGSGGGGYGQAGGHANVSLPGITTTAPYPVDNNARPAPTATTSGKQTMTTMFKGLFSSSEKRK